MRVILHIGLHKTGTSTIQRAWCQAFKRGGKVWYPSLPHGPSHALVAWWTREKSGVPGQHSLADIALEAVRRRTQLLLLSSEEFHAASPQQCARLRAYLRGHEVSLLITLTQPTYRWPSLWQEMVKHGWAAQQAKSISHVDDPAVMGAGRLEGLIGRWDIADSTICLIRQHPPELQLVERVSYLMGVPLPAQLKGNLPPLNTSLGDAETRILCEANRLAPTTRGIESPRGMGIYTTLREHGPASSPRVLLDPDVVDHVVDVAEHEREALLRLAASGRVRLDDAHGLLPEWSTIHT